MARYGIYYNRKNLVIKADGNLIDESTSILDVRKKPRPDISANCPISPVDPQLDSVHIHNSDDLKSLNVLLLDGNYCDVVCFSVYCKFFIAFWWIVETNSMDLLCDVLSSISSVHLHELTTLKLYSKMSLYDLTLRSS